MSKRTIEVCYSNSAKINKGNYEQEAPFYSAKTILELSDISLEEITAVEKMEFNRLRGNVDDLLNAQVSAQKLSLANIRTRIKDGVRCVSVTSVLSQGEKPPVENLDWYARRGTEIERLIKTRIIDGVWEEPNADIGTLKWTDIKYKEFFDEFKSRIEWDFGVFNTECYNLNNLYPYSGEIDLYCPVDGQMTILDFKTGSYKWEQVVAYAKCEDVTIEGFKPVQVGFCDLKKCELKLKPLKDCKKHWESFIKLYGKLEQKFSL